MPFDRLRHYIASAAVDGEGIVTLADEAFCDGLILLADSVRQSYDVPILCFDGGLTDAQRQDLSGRLSNVEIQPIPKRPDVALLRSTWAGDAGRGRREWLLWVCPLLIASSPFRRTLWLDCDLVILQNLKDLFRLLHYGPVFTPSDNKFGATPNLSALYQLLPLSNEGMTAPEPLLNAGVVGFDLQRDIGVLMSYIYPVMCAASNEDIRKSISWHDQGALIWAVRNHCLHDRIVSPSWNTSVRSLQNTNPAQVFSKYEWNQMLFAAMRHDFPDVNILHWNGECMKLWNYLARTSTGRQCKQPFPDSQ